MAENKKLQAASASSVIANPWSTLRRFTPARIGLGRTGVSLPTSIRVDFDRSVTLTLATDKPYEFHDKVQAYYPSDYFVRKVRVKERGKSEQAKSNRDDEHGKGKGKGKDKDH